MQGKVWEPKLSKYTGITKEAWSKGTPRGLLNISVVTYELKVKVLDYAGNPVPEVMLNLTGPLNKVSKTNSYGIATFSKLISGNYSISILFPEIVEEKAFLTVTLPVTKSQDLTLSTNIGELKSKYEELQKAYNNLQEENKRLNAAYNELNTNYNSLKASYETLQNNFEKLQKDYESLKTISIAYGVVSIAIIVNLFAFYIALRRKLERRIRH